MDDIINKNRLIDIKSILRLCRIKQWVKNGFVFAAIIFSGKLTDIKALGLTILTFFLFSLISSSVYIINDILDVEEDRKHPKKRLRPIASGAVSVLHAKILLAVLVISTLLISSFINIYLSGVLLVYFTLNLLYCIKLKKIIIIDVMTIAIGFILRVLAGSVVINVSISPWLFICTGLLSLYLGFGKRKNELIVLSDEAGKHRMTLEKYSLEYLDRILLIILGLTIMTYILYTINGTHYKGMILTIPFTLYGTFRYEYLILNKNIGGSPEDVFLEDKPFLINILMWVLISIIVIYVKI